MIRTDYNPWTDVAERYPAVHVARINMYPYRAAWVQPEGVVFLDENLSETEERSALTHEIAHMDLAHKAGQCREKIEAEADALAARRLIATADLAVGTYRLACELGVTVDVLLARVRAMTPDEFRCVWGRPALEKRQGAA